MNVCYFLKQRQVSEAWHTNLTHCFHQNSHSLPLTVSEGLVRAGGQSGFPVRTVPRVHIPLNSLLGVAGRRKHQAQSGEGKSCLWPVGLAILVHQSNPHEGRSPPPSSFTLHETGKWVHTQPLVTQPKFSFVTKAKTSGFQDGLTISSSPGHPKTEGYANPALGVLSP